MRYRPAAEMLIGCVWLPRFELQVERGREPELAGVPLVLVVGERQPVAVACSPEAEAAGIRPGMPLREALAATPEAVFRPAEPALYEAVFARLADRLEAVSPLVEIHSPGTAFLELEGLLGGVYRDRNALVEALEAVPTQSGFAARFGIGRGKFLAWAAARAPLVSGRANGTGPDAWLSPSGLTCWVEEARRARFLRPLPVRLLPVDEELRGRLERFALRTLGELAALPLSAVVAQFGREGARAWWLARGRDEEPLRPRQTPLEVVETLGFSAPVTTADVLLMAARELLERALRRPERQGRGVRQLRLDARLENRRSWTQTLTLRQPATQPGLLFPPLRYRLERERPPAAVEELTLTLAAFAARLCAQPALLMERDQERTARLRQELRQLQLRLGRSPLARIVEVEPWSRLPEKRYALISYDP